MIKGNPPIKIEKPQLPPNVSFILGLRMIGGKLEGKMTLGNKISIAEMAMINMQLESIKNVLLKKYNEIIIRENTRKRDK